MGTGMWAWLLQRVTGLALIALVLAHFWSKVLFPARGPLHLAVDSLLIVGVAFHALNGLRVALMDLGLGIRAQRAVFWAVLLLGTLTSAFGLKAYFAWYS
jgi:succinate dehydrogenase / fumarate reductase cytochrome b subunit